MHVKGKEDLENDKNIKLSRERLNVAWSVLASTPLPPGLSWGGEGEHISNFAEKGGLPKIILQALVGLNPLKFCESR